MEVFRKVHEKTEMFFFFISEVFFHKYYVVLVISSLTNIKFMNKFPVKKSFHENFSCQGLQ